MSHKNALVVIYFYLFNHLLPTLNYVVPFKIVSFQETQKSLRLFLSILSTSYSILVATKQNMHQLRTSNNSINLQSYVQVMLDGMSKRASINSWVIDSNTMFIGSTGRELARIWYWDDLIGIEAIVFWLNRAV